MMLQPRMFFGLNTNIRKNAYFISEQEILYPTGGVITIHNHKEKSQRYISSLNPDKEISVIAVSLKKKCIAVAEKGDIGEKPRIFVYDLETLKRKTILGIPFEVNTREFMCLTFTHDGIHIVALTGGPDYVMYYYNWQSGKIESQAKANNPPSTPGPVTDMAVNPKDATIAVFVGVSLFRLVSMSENVWRQYGFQKAQNFSILSVCWLTDDRVLAGCRDGKVIIVQSGDLNGVYNINEINEINIITTAESKKEPVKTFSRTASKFFPQKEQDKKEQKIRCFVAMNSGFLFSQKAGEVIYFEKTSKTSYKKSTTFVIQKDVLCHEANYDELYYIHCISTDLNGTKLVCTTNRSQIYWSYLQGHKTEVKEFDIFEEPLHHGPIAGLSTCLWKPVFMTCGHYDNSVRIWNYATTKLLLNQTFLESVKCISLHPTGLYALIGFSDKVRFFLVLINELQIYREFDIRQCHIISFSNNGHLFAAECNYDIVVFSSITFCKISSFQGHYQQITSLQWSYNDLTLYSSSTNGAVYQWSIEKNTRISDVVMQEIEIKGLIALDEKKTICIGNDGSIREIADAKIASSVILKHDNASCLDTITAIQSTNSLLLAGKNGVIISLKYPIDEEPEFNFYSMHNKTVKQFCVMNKERTFVSCGVDGTVCIWDIVPNTCQTYDSSDAYFEEILINIKELGEKNQDLYHLNSRINEMVAEHSFEIKRLENLYCEKIQSMEENNSCVVKNLKKRIKTLEKEHSMELNRIHLDITQMKQTHTLQMDQLDSSFNNKLLYEFQKYDSLKDEMEKLRANYENQLADLRKIQDTEKETQKMQFTSEIDDLSGKLSKVQNTLETERQDHENAVSKLRSQFLQEIEDLKSSYESQLQTETKTSSSLKMDLGITKKKLGMLQKEKEEFKTSKLLSENEYENLKQKHTESLTHIDSLKKIIQTKSENIEEAKQHAAELRKKIKDMSYSKSQLDNKINELKNQLKQNDDQLGVKIQQIHELERTVKKEKKDKIKLQNEILHLNGKLQGKESLLQINNSKMHVIKVQMENIKSDIDQLRDLIQQPEALKKHVKDLLEKYTDEAFQSKKKQSCL